MQPRTQRLSVVADEHDAGLRADVVLARHQPGLSRRMARKMALAGQLRIDGVVRAPSFPVGAGARLELSWATRDDDDPLAPVEVLAVTPNYVYVNKPRGMHTHRLRPSDPPALADAVLALHSECADASEDVREAGAVHRLDRETSGVVAFARTREAWATARQAFTAGRVNKLYLAVTRSSTPTWPPALPPHCTLEPSWVTPLEPTHLLPARSDADLIRQSASACVRICLPLGHGAKRILVGPRDDGHPCETRVWPLGRSTSDDVHPAWLLAVQLRTGFRHQARVHLASLELPILGDTLYGSEPPSPDSTQPLLLHAFRLDLSAADDKEVAVCAPLPSVFRQTIARLGMLAVPSRA